MFSTAACVPKNEKKKKKKERMKEGRRKIKRRQASKPPHLLKFTMDNSQLFAVMDDPKDKNYCPPICFGIQLCSL